MIRVWLMSALLFMLAACTDPISETQLNKVHQAGKLRVGALVGASTYFQAPEEEQGFEFELAQEFADYLGVDLEMVPFFSLSDMFTRLDNGDLDLIASGISFTPERAGHYRFGPSYRNISQKLVFKQGRKRPRDFSDLDGNLTVLAKSSHSQALQRVKEAYPDLRWSVTDELDETEILQAIIDGEIDYTIADSHTLSLFRRYHPNLSIGFSVTRDDPIGWLLRKDNDDTLYALLIEFFAKVRTDNDLYALEEKYFGHVRQFNYVNTLAFIDAVAVTLPNYSPWFKAYAGELDWRLLAALSYQESMWDPRAKSPTGVRGIMMLTLTTAKQVGVKSRLEPEQNIRGGARYLSKLIAAVPDRISEPDRTWFALASYNVGWGHVNDARILTERAGKDPDKWAEVKKHLPLLIKKRYYRTTKYGYARGDVAVTYVDNIRRYYDTLVWLDENSALQANNQDGAASPLPANLH